MLAELGTVTMAYVSDMTAGLRFDYGLATPVAAFVPDKLGLG